ncbi:hypothetical protein GCM10010116_23730 [Microbispora rosea subsp. aerata]|nr:hypothetical protein GCM10010116_23730 [Microbispora rosea subsp. aerata]GIH55698.1 hypothetical protein Mro02_26120 [Microbispora rosea subsp. aerata]GLJ86004.1 hypothetical protein GCM10017588_47370 [Microbispora rosea subsp. aerata]
MRTRAAGMFGIPIFVLSAAGTSSPRSAAPAAWGARRALLHSEELEIELKRIGDMWTAGRTARTW